MRILYIITRADTLAGAQVHVRDLSKKLIKQGHDVQVVTGKPGKYTEILDQANIPFVSCCYLKRQIHPWEDLASLIRLYKLIIHYKPDIVSTHSSKAGILGRIASRLAGKPCIFTAHGWTFTDGIPKLQRTFYRQLERLAEPLADRIICVSDQDRHLGISIGMKPERLVTIHNGMPDIPVDWQTDPGSGMPVRLVMIARFDHQKDHASLLQAMQSIPDVHLDLVGDGPNLIAMQALAHALGISERVQFLGFRHDVTDILSKAHIFTLISNWEGFPRTTLEAMRAGLPVVVSDVGGAKEAVIEGKTGFCIPRGDVNRLTQCLSLLVEDASLRSKMGHAGRQHYLANFTFDGMFEKTAKIYEEILKRRRLDRISKT